MFPSCVGRFPEILASRIRSVLSACHVSMLEGRKLPLKSEELRSREVRFGQAKSSVGKFPMQGQREGERSRVRTLHVAVLYRVLFERAWAGGEADREGLTVEGIVALSAR